MKKLLNFKEFVNESIGAALENPVKFTKIKNNAKQYQQVLVQKSINDIEYEKKKQAAKQKKDSKESATLVAANKAKNQALKDKESGLVDRMDALATTSGLQAVKSLAMAKAKIAAAETSLKAADAEESKQLKVRIKNLNQRAKDAADKIKDYERDSTNTSDNKTA